MSDIVFIGEVPPPYGGVAVKDKLVFKEVYEELGTQMIDLVECKRHPLKMPYIFAKIIFAMLMKKKIIIGVGTSKRRKILLQLQKFLGGEKGLRSVVLLGMGGRMHEVDAKDTQMRMLMSQTNSVWVETEGMIREMNKRGINQARFFPNCRTKENAVQPCKRDTEVLKLVFFSRICTEKGVNVIIEAFDSFDRQCSLDFYGEIATAFKEEFEDFLRMHPQIHYHGVYDAVNGDVYQELNQYDVMLLPSRWMGEGVPGALVESKMAGITAIVSNWNFNKEVVLDGIEGIVLKTTDAENLVKAVNRLCNDQHMLQVLKDGAFASHKRYCIDTYKTELQVVWD